MLEILATYTADVPTIQRLENNKVRVVIHFGHNTVEIVDACMKELSTEELDELVDLWANPECKREYIDLPEGLLVQRAD
jgi:RecJ-like exonuclease